MAAEREKFNPFTLGTQELNDFSDQNLLSNFLSDEPLEDIKEEEDKQKEEEKKAATKKPVEGKENKQPAESPEKKEEAFDIKKALFAKEGEEEVDEETTEEEEESSDEEEVNQFEILSKELYKMGTFIHEGEGEATIATTPEEFKGLFDSQIENKATKWLDGFLGRFGDNYKSLFEAVFINGVNPADYLPAYSEIESLEEIDITDTTNQELVVREYYSRLGWEKNQIEKKIQKLKDYADLEEEATNVHAKLLEDNKEKIVQMEEQKKKQIALQIQQDKDYKTNINKILVEKLKTKEVDGIPLSEDTARKAFDFLYTKKYKSGSQEFTEFDKFIMESRNPENLLTRIKIALLAPNNFDFTKVEKKAVSTESNEIFSELAMKKSKKKMADTTPSLKKQSSWINNL